MKIVKLENFIKLLQQLELDNYWLNQFHVVKQKPLVYKYAITLYIIKIVFTQIV